MCANHHYERHSNKKGAQTLQTISLIIILISFIYTPLVDYKRRLALSVVVQYHSAVPKLSVLAHHVRLQNNPVLCVGFFNESR